MNTLIVFKNLSNEDMSRKEIENLMKMLGKEYSMEDRDKYFLLYLNTSLTHEEKLFLEKRIAWNKEIGFILVKDNIVVYIPEYPIRVMPCNNIKNILDVLNKKGYKLDLLSSHHVYCYSNIVYERIKRVSEKEFVNRHGQNKPGFMPFSLHPRISKALYNIACIKEGYVLDAFCGVAGTIIEGEIIGIKTIGLEKYKNVCEKAYVNMKYYLNRTTVILGDAQKMPFKNKLFDAIISDLPYGRSSKLENKMKVYENFLKEGKRVVKKGGKILIICDLPDFDKRYNIYADFKTSFYVHRSLTRYLYLFEV